MQEQTWKLMQEKEKGNLFSLIDLELHTRLAELEGQKFHLEQVRTERTKLNDECEQLKREISSLKKVKDKLFLEIQRMKMPAPTKKSVMTEKEIQTERESGPEFTSRVA